MAQQQTVRLPPIACSVELRIKLFALAQRTGISDIDVLLRLAVERFVAQEERLQGWITLNTLDRLRTLAPELTAALGKRVVTDEDALCELLAHWERTKTDCYGAAVGKAAVAPPQ